ncbi:uncharacterized protein LOC115794343 isoform X3 [Archocentrus centrarchus]|nr:uncharacterized protein LOC115794343 isoform X3 [Archocentrus centrarchus]XP_030605657.1 uncharacterized protein LOC115794343 isoform X3 [Archocentrus centrarchus]XP_030605658.1 uncharacterized protein LOC115794343 isoform X3 [Archocentrus centrarchus]XP_030605659.1 uncharacterized protein LOC115794343 isoform X3 [Archocentrus centrarchus]
MPSLRMETGRQSAVDHSLVTDLMNGGQICFSCEQIFANRRFLEEHMCSSASFICSCGTEFTEYKHMQEHSTTHEPGHQVLDHETIRKRRIEKRIEEEEKLKRLRKGEVIWNTPKAAAVWTKGNMPSDSLELKPVLQVPTASVSRVQFPVQSPKISQVPELNPSMSQAPVLPNPKPPVKNMRNVFGDVGAPTVDLWTLYQPVVLLQTVRHFSKKKPYACGICGQFFFSKSLLISHHSSHIADKISGCIGCGLLLSSKKIVPRFHVCNSPNSASKFRLITAKPLGYKTMNATSRTQNLSNLGLLPNSSLQVANQNRSAARAAFTLKNQNDSNSQGLRVTPLLQSASRRNIIFPSKSQTPSLRLKMPTNSAVVSSASSGFTCRVCRIPFETAPLLQRHKCVKAREFMAQHVRGSRQQYKKMASPVPAQVNGERKYGIPPSANIKKSQIVTVSLEKGQGMVPVNRNTGVDSDDDCYIVEGGPDKSAEMIYQVTSSVPIKT